MWNEKFSRDGYLYGKEPNVFLKNAIDAIDKKSKILFLGEGEGRNAVYAATKGHDAYALDNSSVGLEKAKDLAKENGVEITTILQDLNDFNSDTKYDYVMTSFMHLAEPLRTKVFYEAFESLNHKGKFVGQFFSLSQVNYSSGGPKDEDLLYTQEQMIDIFGNHDIEMLTELQSHLNEGVGHVGDAYVVNIIVRKY